VAKRLDRSSLLTARIEESERVRGLMAGADDYVIKPFSTLELIARVHGLLRRARRESLASRMTAGDISLDRETRRVYRAEREIPCCPLNFRLLESLMEKPGRLFTRRQLVLRVWGMSEEIGERNVDTQVARLRKALNRKGENDPIRTVRSAGYSFDENYKSSRPRRTKS
jgi:two-component system phosphate regulon response regulator PhoB